MFSHQRGFDPRQSSELSRLIDQFHDEFLSTDDSLKRLESLENMKGYAVRYLQVVPHDHKFEFKQTNRVLKNSVVVNGFDPLGASQAFQKLAKYSHNLMEQPWRKEFHKIKLTSGFYVHSIYSCLPNAHKLLVLLGYTTKTDDLTIQITHFPIPGIKKLKAFSRDCFLASQECVILGNILKRIQQEVPGYPCTVENIFKARKKLVGDSDTILTSFENNIKKWKLDQDALREQEEQRQNKAEKPDPSTESEDIENDSNSILKENGNNTEILDDPMDGGAENNSASSEPEIPVRTYSRLQPSKQLYSTGSSSTLNSKRQSKSKFRWKEMQGIPPTKKNDNLATATVPEKEYKFFKSKASASASSALALTKSKVIHNGSSIPEVVEPTESPNYPSLSPIEVGTDVLTSTIGPSSPINKSVLRTSNSMIKECQPSTDKKIAIAVFPSWNCQHCTFLNTKFENICEMCGPSDSLGYYSNRPITRNQTKNSVGGHSHTKVSDDDYNFPPLENELTRQTLNTMKSRKGCRNEFPEEDWQCQSCTLKNHPSRISCLACQVSRVKKNC